MKEFKINIIIFFTGIVLLIPSCKIDNYDEPNSGIKGRILDAETFEPVPMSVQGKNSLKLRFYEKDRFYIKGKNFSRLPVDIYPMINGTFQNTWMFNNEYLITTEETNFLPIDTITVKLLPKKINEIDILVTPYCRIKIIKAEIEQKTKELEINGVRKKTVIIRTAKVTYSLSRSIKDDTEIKIKNAYLYWHINPYIDKENSNYMSLKHNDSILNKTDLAILSNEYTQSYNLLNDLDFNNQKNQAIIKSNKNQIYLRVGINTIVKKVEVYNYSKVIPLTIDFEEK